MHETGSQWLMNELHGSPAMVSAVRTAMALPVFCLALPAGVWADRFDRRLWLLASQSVLLCFASLMALLDWSGAMTPSLRLVLTGCMGVAMILNQPAWQALMPELVPPTMIPAAVAVGDGYAWIPLHGPGGGLAKIDAARLEVVASVELPESAFDVALAAGSVWVAGLDRRVFEIDAATAEVRRSIDVGAAPRGIARIDDAVWVTLRDDQEVVRIDTRDGTITDRVALDGQPWPIAAADGDVWVADLDGRVTRIDADTKQVTGYASADPQPRAIAIRPDAVWITSQSGRVTRVTLETARS